MKMDYYNLACKKKKGYVEVREFSKTPESNLNIWMVFVYFMFCFSFGAACFFWAHFRSEGSKTPMQVPVLKSSWTPKSLKSFPPGFSIGCSTSSYQIEGGWNADGKGENIWDHLVHQPQNVVKNNGTGDVACDSYHKYTEDVDMIKHVGFKHYRFSVSWSRILPTGHDNEINWHGINYYQKLINELLANGIEPMVTLYHWDLPQPLQELGGWPNPVMADYFKVYANVVFRELGSKVKWWITINEPRNVLRGYAQPEGLKLAPMVYQPGVADYLAAHTLLRAHAKAYHLYDTIYKPMYGGKVSITLDSKYFKPMTDSWEDHLAAIKGFQFELGLFAHPIYSSEGDFPKIVKDQVDKLSKLEGRSLSRLPKFTEEEIKEIKGTFDFFGLNHYTTVLTTPLQNNSKSMMLKDAGVELHTDPAWQRATSVWLYVVPWGLRELLKNIKISYNNPPVFITENGISLEDVQDDTRRIKYHHDYIEQMLLAMYHDDCNVIGYTVWSLMDNFEWSQGFSERFGLYYVNFTDPARPRHPKNSVNFFTKLMETNELPNITSVHDFSTS